MSEIFSGSVRLIETPVNWVEIPKDTGRSDILVCILGTKRPY